MLTATRNLRRPPGSTAVGNVELFFDLVFVLSVRQLAHRLEHFSFAEVGRTAILLGLLWLVWAYTTWVTNWLDPDRMPVRVMLIAMLLGSLVLSAAIPHAFSDHGWWVGVAYAVMQVGRSIVAVAGLAGDPLRRNFQRILLWCSLSGALAVIGGYVEDPARSTLWLLAVAVDVVGGLVGFATPGLGRSHTRDWPVDAGHFAERCGAFVLVALGESIVVIGISLGQDPGVGAARVAAFVVAGAHVVALWWIYFDRSADALEERAAASEDPGAIARVAYHLIHPVMIMGVVCTAAGDQLLSDHPTGHLAPGLGWLLIGGTTVYLVGNAAFDFAAHRQVPWARLMGAGLTAVLALLTPLVDAVVLALLATAIVVGVAASDAVLFGAFVRRPSGASARP